MHNIILFSDIFAWVIGCVEDFWVVQTLLRSQWLILFSFQWKGFILMTISVSLSFAWRPYLSYLFFLRLSRRTNDCISLVILAKRVVSFNRIPLTALAIIFKSTNPRKRPTSQLSKFDFNRIFKTRIHLLQVYLSRLVYISTLLKLNNLLINSLSLPEFSWISSKFFSFRLLRKSQVEFSLLWEDFILIVVL